MHETIARTWCGRCGTWADRDDRARPRPTWAALGGAMLMALVLGAALGWAAAVVLVPRLH